MLLCGCGSGNGGGGAGGRDMVLVMEMEMIRKDQATENFLAPLLVLLPVWLPAYEISVSRCLVFSLEEHYSLFQ